MPRPKSPLTGLRPRNISVRFTEDQQIMFLRLGGSKWLRAAVNAEIIKARRAAEKLTNSETL